MKRLAIIVFLAAASCLVAQQRPQPGPQNNSGPNQNNQNQPPTEQTPSQNDQQSDQGNTPGDTDTGNGQPTGTQPPTDGQQTTQPQTGDQGTTPPISDDPVTVEAYSGLNVFAPMQSTETYLMDNDGEILWTWNSNYRPALSVYLLEDGSLLKTASPGNSSFGNTGGVGGRVEILDWDSNVLWSYDYTSEYYCLHHDIEMLPNGNILMIAWERKTEAEALAAGRDPSLLSEAELWPDHIIEVQPDSINGGGSIVWQWHTWDHLIQDYDASKPNYGVVADHPEKINLNHTQGRGGADWHHINSIDYNEELDQILLSVRNFSEIWVIDHSTTTEEAAGSTGGRYGKGGDLLYRWGNPAAYDRGNTNDQTLFVQHDAEWLDSGNILIFNNGQGRTDGNYSSVDEITPPINSDGSYQLNATAAYGPAATSWTYADAASGEFYAQRISGSQRLPNGNTLICEGTEGRLFEVTTDGTIVWEYIHTNEIFRAERYSYSYPAFLDGSSGEPATAGSYPVVDTGQTVTYGNDTFITAPAAGQEFYGQDAQISGHQPNYTLSADGLTVVDNITGLTWTQSHDWNGDGVLNSSDKMLQANAATYVHTLNAQNYGGFNDWRLPSIKEIYSLMNFAGKDVSGLETSDTSSLEPFIDNDYFAFGYGDSASGERIIDSQFATTSIYTGNVMNGQQAMFGLNLADGRIKGYPTNNKTFYVYFVRGNTDYAKNSYVDNADGTVSDTATALMWAQDDSAAPMNWQDALAWAQTKNTENYLSYNDWRVPNAKELQSIVDYSRSPDATASAAIDPIFNITPIINEGGAEDYPFFWSSTTHANSRSGHEGAGAVYVCFGRAMGYMNGNWLDVHGAGAQRSDPKAGNPDNYPTGNGPQGDAVRILNFVRLVRDQ